MPMNSPHADGISQKIPLPAGVPECANPWRGHGFSLSKSDGFRGGRLQATLSKLLPKVGALAAGRTSA